MPYAFFDHTGDFGVDVQADTAEAVIAEVARAFLDLLTGEPSAVREAEARSISVAGGDREEALVAFGNELLFLFEAEGFLCARFEARPQVGGVIEGLAHGEPFDPTRHPIARPIKALTYHELAFELSPQGATARLIFDL